MALNVTVYGILDALIAPTNNVEEPGQLYWPSYFESPGRPGSPDLRSALEKAQTLDGVTLQDFSFHVAVSRGNVYREVTIADVAPNYFRVLRATPAAGGFFDERDLGFESRPIVITNRLRNAIFEVGDDPIGARLMLGRESGTVVGVIDRYSGPGGYDVYRPQPSMAAASGALIVRVKSGVTLTEAFKELEQIGLRFALERGVPPGEAQVMLRPVMERQFRARNFHYAIIGAVLAVLLVAALNIANLQLARGLNRVRELSTRAALGATRVSLMALIVAETTLVAVAGVGLGIVLAIWGAQLIEATVPSSVGQYITTPQWTWRVFAASGVAGVLLIVVAGVLPAIRVSQAHLGLFLRSSPGAGVSRGSRFVAGGLVVAQVGLALMLCVGGTLLARTAATVLLFDSGIDTERLVAGRVAYSTQPGVAPRAALEAQLAAVRGVGGVTDAAARYSHRRVADFHVVVERGDGDLREIPFGDRAASYAAVTPTFFRVLGVAMARGRDFLANGEPEPVVIINAVAAREWWPGADPIGRTLKIGSLRSSAAWVRVVGVHDDWLPSVSEGIDPAPTFYLSHGADTGRGSVNCIARHVRSGCSVYEWQFIARTSRDAAQTAVAIRDLDPAAIRSGTYEHEMGFVSQRERYSFIASLFTTFAGLGLSLAALGVYAVSAHAVAQRKREFGVRLALGATPRGILAGVLRDGNLLGLLGITIGLVTAGSTVELLKAFLFGMEPMEPVLFGAVALALLGVVLAASLPPALRAARTDPAESFRNV